MCTMFDMYVNSAVDSNCYLFSYQFQPVHQRLTRNMTTVLHPSTSTWRTTMTVTNLQTVLTPRPPRRLGKRRESVWALRYRGCFHEGRIEGH